MAVPEAIVILVGCCRDDHAATSGPLGGVEIVVKAVIAQTGKHFPVFVEGNGIHHIGRDGFQFQFALLGTAGFGAAPGMIVRVIGVDGDAAWVG